VKELVVISGKGGTGKTSLVASLAMLAENKVLADCDVDAADLHLVLEPTVKSREDFVGGKMARDAACVPNCAGSTQYQWRGAVKAGRRRLIALTRSLATDAACVWSFVLPRLLSLPTG